MKAVVSSCVRNVPGITSDSRCMVTKPIKSDMDSTEMSACFSKLRELVPSIPQNKKLSKTQLLQHVIDYILDLEMALETHPAVPALSLSCGLDSLDTGVRQPLSELGDCNVNMAESELVRYQDTTDDFELRPPSK